MHHPLQRTRSNKRVLAPLLAAAIPLGAVGLGGAAAASGRTGRGRPVSGLPRVCCRATT